MSILTDFYENKYINNIIDLQTIMKYDYVKLEACHNYIQWLFPLPEPSLFNDKSPVLTDDDILEFRSNKLMLDNLNKSISLMKDFYYNNVHWMNCENHNHLRISRIIRSIFLITGNKQLSEDFYDFIISELKNNNCYNNISNLTLTYWNFASKGELPSNI
jgi:hypothetical protein